jgi:hypothetical protein
LCPVSIFIDGAHLENLCRMRVEPVIMELLALSSKVIRTDIIKIILGFLPPYTLLTAKNNEEAKLQRTKHNHLAFCHKAFKIFLKDFTYLEKNKDGLQVDIPGLGFVYLHVQLAFIVGDIKGQNPMACHYGAFAANIKIILPVCDCSTAQADILERKCNPTKKEDMGEIIYRCNAAIKQAKHGTVNNAREELTAVSKMGVVSGFREFSFGNNPIDIYGSLPFEILHAWLLVLMEYMLEGVFSHVAPPRKVSLWCEKRYNSNIRGRMTDRPTEHKFTESMVKTDQAEFERRIKIDEEVASRQSDRDIPKTSFNNCLTSLTRLSGQEYPGLIMLTMVTLYKMLPSSNNPDMSI